MTEGKKKERHTSKSPKQRKKKVAGQHPPRSPVVENGVSAGRPDSKSREVVPQPPLGSPGRQAPRHTSKSPKHKKKKAAGHHHPRSPRSPRHVAVEDGRPDSRSREVVPQPPLGSPGRQAPTSVPPQVPQPPLGPSVPQTPAARQPTTTTTNPSSPSMILNGENGRYIFMHKGSPIYEWKQTTDKVFIYVTPPPDKADQVVVKIAEQNLKLGLKSANGWFIDEDTYGPVDVSESKWKLQTDKYKGKKVIAIALHKTNPGELWTTALKGKTNAYRDLDPKSKDRMRRDMLAGVIEEDQDDIADEEDEEQRELDAEQARLRAERQARRKAQEEALHNAQKEARHRRLEALDSMEPITEEEKVDIIQQAEEYLSADIRLISSCQDDQQATDNSNVHKTVGLRMSKRSSKVSNDFGGVCTSVLLKILYDQHADATERESTERHDDDDHDESFSRGNDNDGIMSYAALLYNMRKELRKSGYTQLPTFTSSRAVSMKDGFNIIPEPFSGQRRALIIGINYAKDSPYHIPGCQNDSWNMIRYLKMCQGFEDDDITILMDNEEETQPTRQNILKAFHRFAFGVNPGDAAFFFYAGHGKSTVNQGWDDESAEFDQVMLPLDFAENGGIVDDEIFRVLLVPLQSGVQVTAVVDCCHSGSIFDLPFEFVGNDRHVNPGKEIDFRSVRFPHMDLVRHERRRIQAIMNREGQRASVIERIMVAPPTKKAKRPADQQKKKTAQSPESTKYMQFAAVDEPVDQEKKKQQEERELFWLGCCLLCLNPIKLCRVMFR